MCYYQCNRQEILQKAKESYSKEKAAKYFFKGKEAIKEKLKNWYKNLTKEKKDKNKKVSKKIISAMNSVQKTSINKQKKNYFPWYSNEWKGTKIWQY